ncbi:MAG TPA: hypothetical protein VIC85_01445 [Ktedonobacterales bacterium]|jgi:hypothetical protein
MTHRHTHYWLWFLLFGVIPFIVAAINHFPAGTGTTETYWLVGGGLLGILAGMKGIANGGLAKPYDIIIGIIFTVAGIVGILDQFHVSLGGVDSIVAMVGLSTSFIYALINTFLGLKSLHHGLEKSKA